MNDQKRDNVEVRLNGDGTVDEIVVCDPHDNKCLFHLEQMDDHRYWCRAYGITQDLVVHFGTQMGKIRGNPILGDEAVQGKVCMEGIAGDGSGKMREIKGWEEIDAPVMWSNFEWEDGHHEDEHAMLEYRTPEETRHAKVRELLDRFGIDQVLNDLMTFLTQRGNAM